MPGIGKKLGENKSNPTKYDYVVDRPQGGLVATEGNYGQHIMQKNGTVNLDHGKTCQQKAVVKMEQGRQWTKRDWQAARGGWILQCRLKKTLFYVYI